MPVHRFIDKTEKFLLRGLNKCLRLPGYHVVKLHHKDKPNPQALDEYAEFNDIYNACKNYSMTSRERMFALYKSVEYVVKNQIPGDFVECGVWRGGSSMVIAMTLLKFGVSDRKIYLYDTFDGMPAPDNRDIDHKGKDASTLMKQHNKDEYDTIWCYAALASVQNNMAKTSYPAESIHYIQGLVEETIPQHMPTSIALLRLDTDWYQSTLHELNHLYPLLNRGGVLIIDDYGHWQGARKAVDEYFADRPPLLLNRIDYTGRVALKP